nr:hypothetical protein [Tanacetum cinerariifolium]
LVPITAVRPVTTTVPNPSVTRPRQAKTIVTKTNSPPRRKINRSASPKASTFLPKVTAVKAPMVDAAQMPLLNPQRHVVPTAVITKSKLVPINAARPVTAVVPKPHVTRPKPAKPIVTKPHSTLRRHINRSASPKASNFPPTVTAVKVPHVNAAKGV